MFIFLLIVSLQAFPAVFDLSTLNGENGSILQETMSAPRGSSIGDINGDGLNDTITCDSAWAQYTGICYVVFGADVWPSPYYLSSLNGNNGFIIQGADAQNTLGCQAASVGDINNDGIGDFAICYQVIPYNGRHGYYVIFGSNGTWPRQFDPTQLFGYNGFRIIDNGINTFNGMAGPVGDINGDLIDDFLIPAGGSGVALVYVIYGRTYPYPPIFRIETLTPMMGFVISGVDQNDWLGSSYSYGDINDDGLTDIVLGAPRGLCQSNGRNPKGITYVVFGRKTWPAYVYLYALNGQNGFSITGAYYGDLSGTSLDLRGDLNHDGIKDLLVCSPGFNTGMGKISTREFPLVLGTGMCYVLFGKKNWQKIVDLYEFTPSDGRMLMTANISDSMGSGMSYIGDINGDQIDDFMVNAAIVADGKVYVVYGQKQWSFQTTISNPDGTNGFLINSLVSNQNLGTTLVGVGDVNGDKISDILICGTGTPFQCYTIFGQRS